MASMMSIGQREIRGTEQRFIDYLIDMATLDELLEVQTLLPCETATV